MAKSKMPSIVKLEACFHNLKKQIEELEERKGKVANKLIELMNEEKIRSTPGIDGVGYRITEKWTCDYSDEAYKFARRNGLIKLFTPPMNITRAKVLDALKKNKITQFKFERLQKAASEPELKSHLSSFVLNDAK